MIWGGDILGAILEKISDICAEPFNLYTIKFYYTCSWWIMYRFLPVLHTVVLTLS